jgi:hypothetical protein
MAISCTAWSCQETNGTTMSMIAGLIHWVIGRQFKRSPQ